MISKFKYVFVVLLCMSMFGCSVTIIGSSDDQGLIQVANEYSIIRDYKEYKVNESYVELSKMELDKTFDNPWAMEFIDDNLMVVTEKNGKLSLVDLVNQTVFDIMHKIPMTQYGQGGLLDVLKFEDYLYLSYN